MSNTIQLPVEDYCIQNSYTHNAYLLAGQLSGLRFWLQNQSTHCPPFTAKMTNNIAMIPVGFKDGTLFFQEDDTDTLECDSWKKSEKCEKTQVFRNKQNYVLIARPNDHEDFRAVFEPVTDQEIQSVPGIKFTIHFYQDTNIPRGLPVAFTTEVKSKTYYLCVVKDGSKLKLEFKEGDVPKRITGSSSNLVFNKMPFSEGDSQFFRFESTFEKDYFLAFEWDERRRITRLVVKKKEADDEVDESLQIYHAPLQETP